MEQLPTPNPEELLIKGSMDKNGHAAFREDSGKFMSREQVAQIGAEAYAKNPAALQQEADAWVDNEVASGKAQPVDPEADAWVSEQLSKNKLATETKRSHKPVTLETHPDLHDPIDGQYDKNIDDWAKAEINNNDDAAMAAQDKIQDFIASGIEKGIITNDEISGIIDRLHDLKEMNKAERKELLGELAGKLANKKLPANDAVLNNTGDKPNTKETKPKVFDQDNVNFTDYLQTVSASNEDVSGVKTRYELLRKWGFEGDLAGVDSEEMFNLLLDDRSWDTFEKAAIEKGYIIAENPAAREVPGTEIELYQGPEQDKKLSLKDRVTRLGMLYPTMLDKGIGAFSRLRNRLAETKPENRRRFAFAALGVGAVAVTAVAAYANNRGVELPKGIANPDNNPAPNFGGVSRNGGAGVIDGVNMSPNSQPMPPMVRIPESAIANLPGTTGNTTATLAEAATTSAPQATFELPAGFSLDAVPTANAAKFNTSDPNGFVQKTLDAYNQRTGSDFVWNHTDGMFRNNSGRVINPAELAHYNEIMAELAEDTLPATV